MAVIAMDMTYPQLLLGAVNKKINEKNQQVCKARLK